MNKFFRSYSVASLIVVCVAAIVSFSAYRGVVIRTITLLAEASSVSAARVTLHPIQESLANYLNESNVPGRAPGSVALSSDLEKAISEVMRDSRVVRVKIYNRQGVVSFSTDPRQIGSSGASNPGFIGAMVGKVSVKLVYRDHFNVFDRSTESDNLVQTYLPVRGRAAGPVIGVFETYTNVNDLVMEAESSEALIALVTFVILGGVYGALLLFVSHADRKIQEQQRIILERGESLQRLSQQNMAREEYERKRFATDLHEGLAQTLAAVKNSVENAQGNRKPRRNESLFRLVPVLQNAINQTRAIAVDIRPPSLDDLGLGPTLRNLFGEFEQEHPEIQLNLEFNAKESEMSETLKVVIYRVVESLLKLLDFHPEITKIVVQVQSNDSTLSLLVHDNARTLTQALLMKESEDFASMLAGAIRERVIISGGRFLIFDDEGAGESFCAEWQVQRPSPSPQGG